MSDLQALLLPVLLPLVIMEVVVSGCSRTASASQGWLTAEVWWACLHTHNLA